MRGAKGGVRKKKKGRKKAKSKREVIKGRRREVGAGWQRKER